jgi:ABC-type antimicrobial peptide transport system permease subunit
MTLRLLGSALSFAVAVLTALGAGIYPARRLSKLITRKHSGMSKTNT